MQTLERVVEEHLLFDPFINTPDELVKYGDVYVTRQVITFDPDHPDVITPDIFHIKPEYENEIFVNSTTEVLIIIEKDKSFSFRKLKREDLKEYYDTALVK